jgi:hypothetical protein
MIRGPSDHMHDIKLISFGGRLTTVACYWGLHASPMYCTKARAWRAPPNPGSNFFCQLELRCLCPNLKEREIIAIACSGDIILKFIEK